MGDPADLSPDVARITLGRSARNGLQWFWLIAGISAFNTIAWMTQINWTFVMGLGVTQVFDGFARGLGGSWVYVAVALDLIFIAGFVVIGILARRHKSAYVVGMVLYALDALLLLVLRDFFSALFHSLALWFMYKGLSAMLQLEREPTAPRTIVPADATAAASTIRPVVPSSGAGPTRWESWRFAIVAIVFAGVLSFGMWSVLSGHGSQTDRGTSVAPEPASTSPQAAVVPENITDHTYSVLSDAGMPGLEAEYGKPTSAFTVLVDPEDSVESQWDMPNGNIYYLVWGLDNKGAAKVLAHTVELINNRSLDNHDRDYLSHFVDGVTSLKELNTYFAREGGSWKPIDPKSDVVRRRVPVPAYLWRLADGSGFVALDFSKLSAKELATLDMNSGEDLFDTFGWEASHVRTGY